MCTSALIHGVGLTLRATIGCTFYEREPAVSSWEEKNLFPELEETSVENAKKVPELARHFWLTFHQPTVSRHLLIARYSAV